MESLPTLPLSCEHLKVSPGYLMGLRPGSKPLRSWFDTLTTLSKIEGRPIELYLEAGGKWFYYHGRASETQSAAKVKQVGALVYSFVRSLRGSLPGLTLSIANCSEFAMNNPGQEPQSNGARRSDLV